MPITPAQARAARFSSLDEEYAIEVKRIDSHLGSGGRTIGCDDIPSLVLERIISEYTAAGWHVQRASDWRDGDFLQFKEP